jgi:hypothetical protein
MLTRRESESRERAWGSPATTAVAVYGLHRDIFGLRDYIIEEVSTASCAVSGVGSSELAGQIERKFGDIFSGFDLSRPFDDVANVLLERRPQHYTITQSDVELDVVLAGQSRDKATTLVGTIEVRQRAWGGLALSSDALDNAVLGLGDA